MYLTFKLTRLNYTIKVNNNNRSKQQKCDSKYNQIIITIQKYTYGYEYYKEITIQLK